MRVALFFSNPPCLKGRTMESNGQKRGRITRHRIEIKVSLEQKDVIARGAALSKQTLSEFVRSAAERAARDLISKIHKLKALLPPI
jgi:hypothetical protein